jgi:hypothetical protein
MLTNWLVFKNMDVMDMEYATFFNDGIRFHFANIISFPPFDR